MDWLKREIMTGFQRLTCLCLDRQPANEMIEGTLIAWYDHFALNGVWDESLDTPRFRKAFMRFSSTGSNVWPQPKEIQDLLPDRETFVCFGTHNVEKTEKAAKTIAEIAERLGMEHAP